MDRSLPAMDRPLPSADGPLKRGDAPENGQKPPWEAEKGGFLAWDRRSHSGDRKTLTPFGMGLYSGLVKAGPVVVRTKTR